MPDYDFLDVEYEGNTAFIAFNRPDSLNALSSAMSKELLHALQTAGESARAVVLTGRGKSFSSGADLSEGGFTMDDAERDIGKNLDEVFNPIIQQMRDMPVPTVTAVKGAAAGVGCAIALMGDIIVAGENAYFLQAFCNIGLVPDGGSAYILSRSIGRVRAMEMMLLGERYAARQAYEDGLVTKLVADHEVETTAQQIAAKLAHGPTRAYSLIRKSAWAALDSSLDEQLHRERLLQREAGQTTDFVEGVTAFLNKRAPDFKGR
ncbi:MAG: enoyl-CoA hydratase-related protein [Pseudomonadota bacterium]